jgi:hypothetical protein
MFETAADKVQPRDAILLYYKQEGFLKLATNLFIEMYRKEEKLGAANLAQNAIHYAEVFYDQLESHGKEDTNGTKNVGVGEVEI